jgi:hypothetical protein
MRKAGDEAGNSQTENKKSLHGIILFAVVWTARLGE